MIQKIRSRDMLTEAKQYLLVNLVNRFINYRLPKDQSERMTILPYKERRSFICAVFEPAVGEGELPIYIYLPIRGISKINEDVKSALDEFFVAFVPSPERKAHQLVNFGTLSKIPHSKDYKMDVCHCHCIMACGYALLVANKKHPLYNFPDNIHEFIWKTLSNGDIPEIENPV